MSLIPSKRQQFHVPRLDDVWRLILLELGVKASDFRESVDQIARRRAREDMFRPVFELPLGAVDENRHDAFPIFAYFGHLVRDFVLHGLVSFIRSK